MTLGKRRTALDYPEFLGGRHPYDARAEVEARADAYNAEMAAKGRSTPCICGVSIGVVKDHDPGCPVASLGDWGRQKLAREIVELARQALGDIGCDCPDGCLGCALEKKLELLDAMGGAP
jgi:hypothetical protein